MMAIAALGALAYIVALAVHELAHAVTAIALCLDVSSIRIGALILTRANGNTRFQFTHRLRKALSGRVVAYPTDRVDWRFRLGLTIAAGPVANLLLALLMASLWYFLYKPHAATTSRLTLGSTWLLSLSIASGLIGVVTALPYRATTLTDGDKLALLISNDARSRRWQACVQLEAASRRGVPPRAWPMDLVRSLTLVRDGTACDTEALFLAYCHALDIGNLQQAVQFLDAAQKSAQQSIQPSISVEQ